VERDLEIIEERYIMGRKRIHKLIDCICPCGNKFQENEKRVNEGRGKYCGKKCFYKYHGRRSGLKYNIIKENPTWFKKGVIPKTAWKLGDTTGSKNANWKGGVTDENERIRSKERNNAKMKRWRKEVLKRDNYTCVLCDSNKRIEVDHIKPYSLYPELRYNIDNGRVLCRSCHKKTDTYGSKIKTWKPKRF